MISARHAYRVDPSRTHYGRTQIPVRAQGTDGRYGSYDISVLDRESLIAFVRSRGEVSEWALSLILLLLDHGR